MTINDSRQKLCDVCPRKAYELCVAAGKYQKEHPELNKKYLEYFPYFGGARFAYLEDYFKVKVDKNNWMDHCAMIMHYLNIDTKKLVEQSQML